MGMTPWRQTKVGPLPPPWARLSSCAERKHELLKPYFPRQHLRSLTASRELTEKERLNKRRKRDICETPWPPQQIRHVDRRERCGHARARACGVCVRENRLTLSSVYVYKCVMTEDRDVMFECWHAPIHPATSVWERCPGTSSILWPKNAPQVALGSGYQVFLTLTNPWELHLSGQRSGCTHRRRKQFLTAGSSTLFNLWWK